jgi:hypothetical protein
VRDLAVAVAQILTSVAQSVRIISQMSETYADLILMHFFNKPVYLFGARGYDDECLLGSIALTCMDLAVNPRNQRLVGRHEGGPVGCAYGFRVAG